MARNNTSDKSWERQTGESEKAYEAFYAYLQMGEERSLRAVEKKLAKSHTLISRWSAAHGWQKRVRDYDNYLVRQELAEQEKQARSMRKRQIGTAVMLQKKAVEALEQLDMNSLTPQEILKFITEGAKLERQNRAENRENASGETSANTSLADVIIAAYRQRTEGGND